MSSVLKAASTVVTDFKTGSARESKNTIPENIQMTVYSLAIQHRYGVLPKVAQLFYLEDRKNPTVYVPNYEQIQQQQIRLTGLVNSIVEEQFAARSSYEGCKYCSYEMLCHLKST